MEILLCNFIRKFGEQFIFTRSSFSPDLASVTLSEWSNQSPSVEGGSSSELAIVSDHKGIILPYHNEVTIDSLVGPVQGSLLFDTISNRIHVYDGTNWVKIISKAEFITKENIIPPTPFGLDVNGSVRDSFGLLNFSDAGGVIILPPFSKIQILSIDKPSPGMLVYNTDDKVIAGFNGTSWQSFKADITPLVSSGSTLKIDGFSVGKDVKHQSAVLEISSSYLL